VKLTLCSSMTGLVLEGVDDRLKLEIPVLPLGLMWHELGLRWHELGLRWHELGLRWHELGLRWHELGLRWHELGLRWHTSRSMLASCFEVVDSKSEGGGTRRCLDGVFDRLEGLMGHILLPYG
jgi:hypothetical protein